MTTFDPGASVVLTHGLRVSPRSTAFLASRAAPIMTDGFDVLVQDVMAAITTAPWSISNEVPSSRVTGVGLDGRSSAPATAIAGQPSSSSSCPGAAGSEAGKLSRPASSTDECDSTSECWT